MYQKRNIKFLKLYFFLLGQEDLMFELIMQFNNKNFNRSMEGNLPALKGNYDRQTDKLIDGLNFE